MGDLYYNSLGNTAGGPLGNTGPFENLFPIAYWYGLDSQTAGEIFSFYDGGQGISLATYGGIGVHSGVVVYNEAPVSSINNLEES
jgi:hypothetical protein